jgi:hypothetical protein
VVSASIDDRSIDRGHHGVGHDTLLLLGHDDEVVEQKVVALGLFVRPSNGRQRPLAYESPRGLHQVLETTPRATTHTN